MCRLLQGLPENSSARQGVKVIIYKHYMTVAPKCLGTRDDSIEGVFSADWGEGYGFMCCLDPMCVWMGLCLLA